MKNEELYLLQTNQNKFFQTGKTKEVLFRIENLKKLYNIIDKNESKILEALKNDLNKSTTEAYTSEIAFVLKEINIAIKNLYKWNKPKKVSTELINKPGSSFIKYEPYGCVLIISPWNYPFSLLFTPLVSAIAAGNCVIAKPSELSINSSKLISELIENNFPKEYIAIVEGDGNITQLLINDKINYIFFTGSAEVGKKIMKTASDYLIPITFELGGKNPCIVDSTVDIEVAVKRIVWGKYFNAGQTCVAPDYILLHNKIKDEFLNCMIHTINEFYNNNFENGDEFPHIINVKHFERIANLLDKGNIIVGGKMDKVQLYISPTVITNVDYNSKIMQEEVFGPLLPILFYSNLDEEIIRLQNKAKPLCIYYFSKNTENQNKIINLTTSGNVCINGTINSVISHELPFGGVGNSGIGNYHGKYGFETFSHKKSIIKKYYILDNKLVYPPYQTPLSILKKAVKLLY